jgi:DNA-binding transcriptional ArsR family regulator
MSSLEIKFITLVDNTLNNFDATELSSLTELCSLYEYFEISYENICQNTSLTPSVMMEHLEKLVQKIIISNPDSDNSISRIQLELLRDNFILSYIVDEEALDIYFPILQKIIDFMGSRKIYSLDHEIQWQKAIKAAHLYIKDSRFSLEHLQGRYKRQFAVGYAAKSLKKKGYEVSIEDGKVIMKSSEQERLIKQLEDDIKFLGGINIITQLFVNRENDFAQQQERYHLVRTFDSNEPNVPVSYLLNLAVKNPLKSSIYIAGSPEDTWKRLIETSTEFTAIFDVQLYEQPPIFFQTIDTLVKFLQDITVYDSIFTLTQLRPSDVLRILLGLFGWIDRGLFRTKTGLDLDQIFEVIETIIQSANHDRKPTYYDFQSLASKMPNISHESLRKILDILSHEKSANHNLKLPNDISSVVSYFQFKPLLKTSNDEYVMLNPSWCSPAFYEAIFSHLKEDYDKKIHEDNRFGKQIEKFIRQEFSQKGISYSHGDYVQGKETGGDCDIVVETSDTIILIEVKKKALTRKAKSGDEFKIFVDIADSLIKAQSQLLNAELLIRTRPEGLQLDTGSTIHLNDRNIAKIVITLLDFGGLNDRNVVLLLESIVEKLEQEISVNKTKLTEKKETETKEIIKNIQKELKELNNLQSTTSNSSPFFNSWFLSLPQLLVLLDNVNSNDSLKTELWKTRRLSASTLDFYREYSFARDLLG